MSADSDATSVRIAPRDYSTDDSSLKNKDDAVATVGSDASAGSVSMMIGEESEQEHEEGDVTDRYLIKEIVVKDKSEVKSSQHVLQ